MSDVVPAVDVHTHVVPRDLPLGLTGHHDLPRVVEDDGTHVVHVQGRPFRTIAPVAWDLDERRTDMERDGVAVQVLSPMPDLYGYWDDPSRAEAMCDALNGWLTDAVGRDPNHFRAFGSVPLQDPDRAAAALGRIADSHLAGVAIGSNVEGRALHDPAYREFFAEAERLDLVVFVHAYRPPSRQHFTDRLDANACTFPNDVGLALAGLLSAGVFTSHPGLSWLFSHGGGSAVFAITRLSHLRRQVAADGEAADSIRAALDRVFVDLLVYSPALLRAVFDVLDDTRVVVGSDYPFLPGRPGEILDDMPELAADVAVRVRRDNAHDLLGPHAPPLSPLEARP